MMEHTLHIGGIGIRLRSRDCSVLPGEIGPFVDDSAQPLATCEGRLGPVKTGTSGELLFDSGGPWRVERADTGVRIVLRTNEPEGRDYHTLDLDEDLSRGDALLDATVFDQGRTPYPLRDPLHEIWTSFLLMRDRGLMVHGCGVRCEDGVHLFVGRSGIGKSTMAGLLDRMGVGEILSDDRLIVRRSGDGYRVWGTPWRGLPQFASPKSGSLASVSFLTQADESKRRRLGADDAAARLFDACYVVGWPRRGIEFVLDMSAEVARRVPCYGLRFLPDRSAVEAAGFFEVTG